jgi:hypothetical protein
VNSPVKDKNNEKLIKSESKEDDINIINNNIDNEEVKNDNEDQNKIGSPGV